VKRAISKSIQSALGYGYSFYLNSIGTIKSNKGFPKKKIKRKKNRIISNDHSIFLDQRKKTKNKKLIALISKEFNLKKSRSKSILKTYSKSVLKSLDKYRIATLTSGVVLSKNHRNVIGLISLNLKTFKPVATTTKFRKKKKKKSKRKKNSHSLKKENQIDISDTGTTSMSSAAVKEVLANTSTESNKEVIGEIQNLERLSDALPDKDGLKEVLKDHFYQEDEDLIVESDIPLKYPEESIDKSQNTTIPVYSNDKGKSNQSRILSVAGVLLFLLASIYAFHFFKSEPETELLEELVDESAIHSPLEVYQEDEEEINYGETLSFNEEKCIIITGSFSNQKYESKMRSTLIENGYQPYSENNNGITRVGIQFDCESQDPLAYLDEVRNTIDKKAWFLYPPQENL